MPQDPTPEIQRFILLLDEYIGCITDLPADAEFAGHFILEEKINAKTELIGFISLFRREEKWRHPNGGVTVTVPHDASDETWDKVTKRFGDIDEQGYTCELHLWVARPHGIGGIMYPDLPLRGFRNNENFTPDDRAKLIAVLREWQRAARTQSVEQGATRTGWENLKQQTRDEQGGVQLPENPPARHATDAATMASPGPQANGPFANGASLRAVFRFFALFTDHGYISTVLEGLTIVGIGYFLLRHFGFNIMDLSSSRK